MTGSDWTRREQLAALAGGLAAAALPARVLAQAGGALPVSDPGAGPSLRQLAAEKGILFGSAVSGRRASPFDDPAYRDILIRECGVIVPENEMKLYVVGGDPKRPNFAPADRLAAFARTNGMKLRGHTLLWNRVEYMPAPLAAQIRAAGPERWLRDYIARVCTHFPQVYSWDVVNETIDPKTGGLRDTVFTQTLGFDALRIAYEAAREHAPRAQRVYNDYMSWERGNETHRAGVLRLLEQFRAKNVPVDALGIQSHIGTDGDHSDAQRRDWMQFVDRVTDMGYRLLITEFDVNDKSLTGDIAKRDAEVAAIAKDYLDRMLSYRQLDQLLFWGMIDKYSWLQGFTPRPDKLPQRPLPYDAAYRPKPLGAAVAAALRAAPARGVA
ncbi:beta-xylanase [Sphingomonas metalli]|uniref:Beta-xylanase n=1 Tax=Sphingomonas metalli TaxID=1779358 RepID=A0A916T0X7_9SPHN|nr:endo-1,4-beta-xylanase [Sphingomonas metalli]GGB27265.1 beta-xylanase [Sphingomonas metalli]